MRKAFYISLVLIAAISAGCAQAQVKVSEYPWINTWAYEYYNADVPTLNNDTSHFDAHMSPQNITGVKTKAPTSLALLYHIWREQYVGEEEGAVEERRKIDLWCTANNKDKETFYCHYKRDVAIKSVNLVTGKADTLVIPGWDPANDANNDGVRDYPSDYGTSTSVGSGYLTDTKKNWTSDQWVNAYLVDNNGQLLRVTSNTSNRITVSGTPASGRYGLSADGSVNHYATAANRPLARIKTFIWQDYAYAMNVGNINYRAYRCYDASKLIVEGDTVWDTDANTAWDGLMVDNTSPEFPWPEIVNGIEEILEYPNKSAYRQDQVTLIGEVKTATGKLVIPNTGSYDFTEAADAGGGQHQEQYVAVVNEHGPTQWNHWKQQSDKSMYCLVLPTWDCLPTRTDLERMHYLAFHYIGQQPYIYLGFRGFGYRSILDWPKNAADWFPAVEVDIGEAVDGMYSVAASGKYLRTKPYTIYKRQYENALILSRPKLVWSEQPYDTRSAVTYRLPYYQTTTGISNQYKQLNVDGTFGKAVSRLTFRISESFIMFPALPFKGWSLTKEQLKSIEAESGRP